VVHPQNLLVEDRAAVVAVAAEAEDKIHEVSIATISN
jgi:hypothetical protein